jgi:hypothetical protein
MNRNLRQLAAWLTLFALMFAQLAVAAYACPGAVPEPAASTQVAPSPCDNGVDTSQANLCEKHCHDSQQTQNIAPAIGGIFVPGFIAVLRLPDSHAPAASAGCGALLHASSPPATLRNCCFRI